MFCSVNRDVLYNLQDLGAATEELRRLQSEKDRQMVEQLAQSREEIRRLSRQVEAREARLISEQETTWQRPRQTRSGGGGSGGMPERHLPGTSDLRGEYSAYRLQGSTFCGIFIPKIDLISHNS